MQSDLGPLPIDHRDFLLNRDVKDMPPIAFKAFVLLLCELWESGSLPRDTERLAAYAGVSHTIFRNKIWGWIAGLFFDIDDEPDKEPLIDHEFTREQRGKAVKGLVARMKMSEAVSRRAKSRS